jgi:hypothetical protein
MARTTRVELNRRALHELALAFADGVHEVGKRIVEVADPPDAAPYGEGLITRGGVLTYVDAKKVAGWTKEGEQPSKPRSVVIRRERGNILAIVGFGFPGHFQELGTVHHRAQPFLTPAVSRVEPEAIAILDRVVRPKLV